MNRHKLYLVAVSLSALALLAAGLLGAHVAWLQLGASIPIIALVVLAARRACRPGVVAASAPVLEDP